MKVVNLNITHPASLPPLALTIGNYDGVHLGHQAMLAALMKGAKQKGLASAVMVFEPQPREFFCPNDPPPRLTNLPEKIAIMTALGVEYLIVARFDEAFRRLSADDFVLLLHKLNVWHLVLGDDFRFGHDRVGDMDFLMQAGFFVEHLATVSQDGVRISSTAIRVALIGQDLMLAKRLLGRDYAMTGQVVHGDKIGRTLGFATANVSLQRLKPAVSGVYGADVFALKDGEWLDLSALGGGVMGTQAGSLFGAVSVGRRPSVHGMDDRLEVHLPNFHADLYGITLKVVFLHYLHGEKKYANMDELKMGIAKDVADLLHWRSLIA